MKKSKNALIVIGSFIFFICLCCMSSCRDSNQASSGKQWNPESGRAPQKGDEWTNPRDQYVMVWIPGGKFQMGSEDHDADERPRHEVTVEGFWFGKYEVTNQQYAKFIRETGAPEPGYWDDTEVNAPNKPVTAVKFYEAQYYCDWSGLRLPTEAEWEYVASGGRQDEFPTDSGNLSHNNANYWGKDGKDQWLESPAPVGSFAPNPYGVYDLAGNVWEWTSSLWYRYPYIGTDGREDSQSRFHRVMRGGSFQFGKEFCRTTQRHRFLMHLRYDYVGLRLCRNDLSKQVK